MIDVAQNKMEYSGISVHRDRALCAPGELVLYYVAKEMWKWDRVLRKGSEKNNLQEKMHTTWN